MKLPELVALLCYFVLVLGIGVYFFFKPAPRAAMRKNIFSAAEI